MIENLFLIGLNERICGSPVLSTQCLTLNIEYSVLCTVYRVLLIVAAHTLHGCIGIVISRVSSALQRIGRKIGLDVDGGDRTCRARARRGL